MPRALAGIHYNSTIEDTGTSSEDEAPEAQHIPADDARAAIGISISREQVRLNSPKTPAVEKAAALASTREYFGLDGAEADALLVEEPEENDDETQYKELATTLVEAGDNQLSGYASRSEVRNTTIRDISVGLPSPWRAESSVQWQQSDKARYSFLDGLFFNRQRASTNPGSTPEGWQKALLSSLPSMPKHFSLSSPFSSSQEAKARTDSAPRSPSVLGRQRSESDSRMPPPKHITSSRAQENQDPTGEVDRRIPAEAAQRGSVYLRRSASDQSLVTRRTLSTVESLGDDSRFEHVQDQVNNRLKALRDSWQDSNIRLPSLPNISRSSFTPDFFRDRSGALNKRYSLRQAAHADHIEASGNLDDSAPTQPLVDPIPRQRYTSSKEAASNTASEKAPTHPHFSRALEQLDGDIVVLGGYRGSVLRAAEPPHRQVWVPMKAGLNIRKVNLQVGLGADDDERATESIIPGGMLTHIGPIDIARRLFKRLRSCNNATNGKLRVHDYGYDWRLDPTHLSRQLVLFLETLPCNRPGGSKEKRGAIVVAHSLGGLVTRHAVNQRPELIRGVVYAGAPETCVNILGPMRNGDEVLLSNRVLTAQVNFSIRTSFALLPLNGRCFFDKQTKEEYHVDFFDPQTWIDLKLSPCVGRPLPRLNVPTKPSGITGYVTSMASALPSLSMPGRKASIRSKIPTDAADVITAGGVTEPNMLTSATKESNNIIASDDLDGDGGNVNTPVGAAVTIPREKAIEYLTRTLASVKTFKQDLAFHPPHAASNMYPPVSVIYGKSTPTVYGAKVNGKEGIKYADAYDELAFASGDGVVLARAAMVPQGYTTARGGVVSSERGHVTLLSDLEAVGKCLNAIMAARKKGVGLGN